MSRAARLLLLGAVVLALLIALLFYRRIDAPKEGAWWAGRDVVVRLQVWEAGKDMPTVSMSFPKKAVDRMVALGLQSEVSMGGERKVDFGTFWHDLQRLPRGQKLRFEEDGDSVLIWIEEAGKRGAASESAPAAPIS